MRPVAVLALLASSVMLAGCGAADARPPLTVVSLQSVQDVTLSDGSRIHNVGIRSVYGLEIPGTCEGNYELAAARTLMVGAHVTDLGKPGHAEAAPAGYTSGVVYVRTDNDPYDDLSDDLDAVVTPDALLRACPPAPVTEEAPLSGREVADSPGSDVRVDVDRDGESRFCARRWWC